MIRTPNNQGATPAPDDANGEAGLAGEAEHIAELFERVQRTIFAFKFKSPQAQPPPDLTMVQMRCLWKITRHENCTLRELSERLNVSASTASEMVDKLVRSDLVEREADLHDRRIVRLRLAPKGRELHDQHRKARREHLRQFLDRLTPGQRRAMIDALEALDAVVREVPQETGDALGECGR